MPCLYEIRSKKTQTNLCTCWFIFNVNIWVLCFLEVNDLWCDIVKMSITWLLTWPQETDLIFKLLWEKVEDIMNLQQALYDA